MSGGDICYCLVWLWVHIYWRLYKCSSLIIASQTRSSSALVIFSRVSHNRQTLSSFNSVRATAYRLQCTYQSTLHRPVDPNCRMQYISEPSTRIREFIKTIPALFEENISFYIKLKKLLPGIYINPHPLPSSRKIIIHHIFVNIFDRDWLKLVISYICSHKAI